MSPLSKLLLLIVITTSLFLSYPRKTYAQVKKQSPGIWQLITLKKLLIAEQATIEQKEVLAIHTKKKITTPIPTRAATQKLIAQKLVPTPTPTTAVQQPTDDIQAFIMQKINEYRAKYGLSPVHTTAETCNFATIRAEEITHNFSHDGFYNRSASKTIPYKSGSRATENLAHAYNYHDVVDLWANSPTHAQNMRADTPYVCVVKNGDYYAYEGLTP